MEDLELSFSLEEFWQKLGKIKANIRFCSCLFIPANSHALCVEMRENRVTRLDLQEFHKAVVNQAS